MNAPTFTSMNEFYKFAAIAIGHDILGRNIVEDLFTQNTHTISGDGVSHDVLRANDFIEIYWTTRWTQEQKEKIFVEWVKLRLAR